MLADVLLHYMARIGKTMAHLVEASMRPSSHSNALDALQAIQMTTAPAAHQVNNDATPNAATVARQKSAPWQDLAVFLFGPKWEGPLEAGLGGKVGPSAVASTSGGWKAPFLEEIPPFPLASDRVANPHRLKDQAALSLHGDVSEMGEEGLKDDDLNAISDKVFTGWGMMGPVRRNLNATTEETNKEDTKPVVAPTTDENLTKEEATDEPPRKKQKISEDEPSRTRPPYVASFMPRFPTSLKPGRAIVDVPVATTATVSENMSDIRSSLVELGHNAQYWGSGWDAAPSVPAGLSKTEPQTPVVVPLGRASNSRVSRILEGSMDAVH